MHQIRICAAVAMLAGCGGSAPLSDNETKELVRSVVHQDAQCIENQEGMLISCGAGNRAGRVDIYVTNAKKTEVRVDMDLSAGASTGTMISFNDYLRDRVEKLGLVGNDYRTCTEPSSERKSSSYRLKDYRVECVTYASMSTMKFEMKFTRR